MGKEIPRSFEKIRSGEQIQHPTFTNVAAAVAAGVTAAKFPRRDHLLERRRDWCGAVPGDQRRHELEADRDWRERHLSMNGLLPIIRRVRRPLLPVEAPADAKPAAAPVPSEREGGGCRRMSRRRQAMRKLPRIREGDRPRAGSRRWLAWLATWLADRRRERQSAPPTVPVPEAPSNLSVSVEEGFFIVMWQDNSSDETGFRVYRKAFSGPYGVLAEFPEDTTVFGDFDVERGVYYT